MTTLKLTLEYDGTGFAGWAAQPGLRTVEHDLREALDQVFPGWDGLGVAGHAAAHQRSYGLGVFHQTLQGLRESYASQQYEDQAPKVRTGQLIGSIVAGEEKGYSEVKKSTATGFSNME